MSGSSSGVSQAAISLFQNNSINSVDDLPPHLSLSMHGLHAQQQYESQGRLEDLELCIRFFRQAVEVSPDDDPFQLSVLASLGIALSLRFKHLEHRADLEESISITQLVAALAPDDSSNKYTAQANLAISLRDRFELDGNLGDLQEAITLQSRAMELIPLNHNNRFDIVTSLGSLLAIQYQQTGIPEDLEEAIRLQSQAVQLGPKDHDHYALWLDNLGCSLEERFQSNGRVDDLEQAIHLQERAVQLTDEGHRDKPARLTNLGSKFVNRFERVSNAEDLEKAISLFDRAVQLTSDGHSSKSIHLSALANALRVRFGHNGFVDDLTRAIACQRRAVDLTPEDHIDKPARLNSLGTSLHTRFNYSGNMADLDEAIVVQSKAVELTPEGRSNQFGLTYNLANSLRSRFEKVGEVEDLNEALRHTTKLAKLLPSEHSLRASILLLLGRLYRMRLTSPYAQAEDLMNSLNAFSEAMLHESSPPTQRLRSSGQYAELLTQHSHLVPEDSPPSPSLLEAYGILVDLIPQCVWLGNDINSRLAMEEMVAYGGLVNTAAAAAIASGDLSLALEWLESGHSLVWSQVVQLRTPLDDLRRCSPKLANDLLHVSQALQRSANPAFEASASPGPLRNPSSRTAPYTQVQSSHSYASAYEKLLGQIRGLEGFEDFLRPRKLQQLTDACRSGPVVFINMNVFDSHSDALVFHGTGEIKHISLPRISYKSAGVLHKQLWSLLSSNRLRNRSRSESFPADTQENDTQDRGGNIPGKRGWRDPMFQILADLWKYVVKPVLDFIRTLPNVQTVNNLYHVTWCPTGPLAFLPLHAAGIYQVNGTSTETVMDYAYSSYTPTLEALLRPSVETPSTTATGTHAYPRSLVVSQPFTPGYNSIPATTTEAAIVLSLVGHSTNTFDDEHGTVRAVLDGMATHDWVHLACHGVQNRGDPTNSAFILYDGRLTLSTLMSTHIPHADLAVLSACQTASGDDGLPEEAVHLAAGMLNVGYKSVVGTMWSIDDGSAPVAMARFYEVMMEQVRAGGELQAGYALYEATKVLRKKYGLADFMRWVPFVHFGL